MRTKLTCVSFLATICLTVLSVAAGAAAQDVPRVESDDSRNSLTTAGPETPQRGPMRPESADTAASGGSRPPAMDLSHLNGQASPRGYRPRTLPSSYDWRTLGKVSPVKSQGECGSCYSFAAIGNVESKLLIDNAGTYDFSENHAKECNWRERTGYEDPPGQPWGSCDGGNYYMLANLFSREGLILETSDPYVNGDVACSCLSGCAYNKTLLDWRIISANAIADTNVLKQYILDNGPVYTMMDIESVYGYDYTYDGSYTFDYTMPGLTADHCVLIVGWSNNLPPVPGGTGPADGWIVKNSWGSSWGDNGYFYATYGAANLGIWSSYMHDWQQYNPKEDVWSYDEDGFTNRYGFGDTTAWGLARFTPDVNTEIVRVEFWTTDVTTDVDVYLYDSFNGSTLSNLRAQVLNRSFSEAGYHSVQLSSPVPVNQGDDIFAVVKITNAEDRFPIAVDENGPFRTGTTYFSHYGTSWTDLGTTHGVDAAIRLRTRVREPGVLDQSVYLPLVVKRYPPIPDVPVLNAIGNPDGDGSYTVSWSSAYLANTYTLQEDKNAAFSSPSTAYSGPGTSTFITGRAPGTYFYRVRARNAWGYSGWSNTRQVTVSPPMAEVYVKNDTGGQLCYEVDNTGIGRKCFSSGTHYYGTFPSGTYTWHASAWCGSVSDSRYYGSGEFTHRFWCD